jgi:hypothetical protein
VDVRETQVASRHPAGVGQELFMQRSVETELLAHELVVRRVAVLAGQSQQRFSGCQMNQKESHGQDRGRRGHDLKQASDDVTGIHGLQVALSAK